MTYKQAYDKIIEAYFKDEIEPYMGQFCFCGTLAWKKDVGNVFYFGWEQSNYNINELHRMEAALLTNIRNKTIGENKNDMYVQAELDRLAVKCHPDYESALFSGMCAALEVLKDIHRSRGENVDELPALKPRKQII